jgi:hypothetical protein
MSLMYELRVLIDNRIKADGLDEITVRGEIGLRAGRLVSLISPRTLDDPAALAKLRQAAKEVLNIVF